VHTFGAVHNDIPFLFSAASGHVAFSSHFAILSESSEAKPVRLTRPVSREVKSMKHENEHEEYEEVCAPRLSTILANTGNFGAVCVKSFRDELLILNNSGKRPLSVTNITSSSPEFLAPLVSQYPLAIGAGVYLPVPIRFQPTYFGTKEATITIYSDDPSGPHEIAVSGDAPSGKLAVTGSTSFGGITARRYADRTISICNVGDSKLHVRSVAFKRASVHWKILNNPFPATLHAGACLGLTIRYKATEKYARCCELIIVSDDPSVPVRTLELLAYTVSKDYPSRDADDGLEDDS
jgi:hypothetical protein